MGSPKLDTYHRARGDLEAASAAYRAGGLEVAVHGTEVGDLAHRRELERDLCAQIAKSEGGRCFTQGNGSIIYMPRWSLYNPTNQATFGDNGTTEVPFEQSTSFSVDDQFIYNQITATQNRGPNQDIFYQQTNYPSQFNYFNRSGLDYQSYVASPFDIYGIVDWNAVKYNNPVQRTVQMAISVAATQGKQQNTFGTILGLELQDTVTINRRPIGAGTNGTISTVGPIQQIKHSIGASTWDTTYQVTPQTPDNNALVANQSGFNTLGSSYLSWLRRAFQASRLISRQVM